MSEKKMDNKEHKNLNTVLNKLNSVENNLDKTNVKSLIDNPSELDKWWSTLTNSNQTSLMCLIKQYVDTNSDDILLKIKENISPESSPYQSSTSKIKR
jgi:hypothetical protein